MIARHLSLPLILLAFIFPSYDRNIDIAINQLYNFELSESIKTLERMSLEYPEDPIVPFLKVSAYWQYSLLYDSPESSYEIIENGIDEISPFYTNMIEKYP